MIWCIVCGRGAKKIRVISPVQVAATGMNRSNYKLLDPRDTATKNFPGDDDEFIV